MLFESDSHNLFWNFGGNRKNEEKWKSGHIKLLCRSVGNPRCGVDLHQGVGCLVAARLRCQNGTPRVYHDIAVLRCGLATVHSENFFFNFVSEHLVFVHR